MEDIKFVEVRETKEKEGIDEVNNERLTHIVQVEHFQDSWFESTIESKEKVGDFVYWTS